MNNEDAAFWPAIPDPTDWGMRKGAELHIRAAVRVEVHEVDDSGGSFIGVATFDLMPDHLHGLKFDPAGVHMDDPVANEQYKEAIIQAIYDALRMRRPR